MHNDNDDDDGVGDGDDTMFGGGMVIRWAYERSTHIAKVASQASSMFSR